MYSLVSKQPWQDQSRQALRNTLAMTRAGRPPSLDITRCIIITPPSKFLQYLWMELCGAANIGETETCTRLATFVLTTPRSPSTPPLLPLFLHNVLPWIIANIDHQQPHEQTMNAELLVAIMSSALTAALHLEWALRSVCDEERYVLGQSSTAMARRLAVNLRGRKNSPTGRTIAQRLASSQSFVANFPGCMGELGI
jgi:mediator of RNA polymerase II transcription subunit 5